MPIKWIFINDNIPVIVSLTIGSVNIQRCHRLIKIHWEMKLGNFWANKQSSVLLTLFDTPLFCSHRLSFKFCHEINVASYREIWCKFSEICKHMKILYSPLLHIANMLELLCILWIAIFSSAQYYESFRYASAAKLHLR